jgi:hypothetical protein
MLLPPPCMRHVLVHIPEHQPGPLPPMPCRCTQPSPFALCFCGCHCADVSCVGQAFESLGTFDEALGLAHHHDAISGTAKQAVANDYARRLASARARLQSSVSRTLSAIIFDGQSSTRHSAQLDLTLRTCTPTNATVDVGPTQIAERDAAVTVQDNGREDTIRARLPPLHHCTAANVSICPIILEQSASCEVIMVVLYNPVAWTRTAWHQV